MIPEIKTSADDALRVAQKEALTALIPKTDDPELKAERERALQAIVSKG